MICGGPFVLSEIIGEGGGGEGPRTTTSSYSAELCISSTNINQSTLKRSANILSKYEIIFQLAMKF